MATQRNTTKQSTRIRKTSDVKMGNIQKENFSKARGANRGPAGPAQATLPAALAFVDTLSAEIDTALEIADPNPHLNMVAALLKAHLSGKIITATMLISASGVPYATARRKLQ